MKALVFGKAGQVATELRRQHDDIEALARDQADLTNPDACAAIIACTDADVIINAAAYTAVDDAETDAKTAEVVNADAPGAMARAAAARGIPFVHISTDYVFDGSGDTPWQPGDKTGPLGEYGRTKLLGENAVVAAGGTYAILRTSWVFSAHGNNFVKTMLGLGRKLDHLKVVADQIGGPTAAADIAQACLGIAGQLADDAGKSGTYHFAGAPNVSWAGFAREIFAQAGLTPTVTDIPTSEFLKPAKRPGNSRLDCTTLSETFTILQPDWRIGLSKVLAELAQLQD